MYEGVECMELTEDQIWSIVKDCREIRSKEKFLEALEFWCARQEYYKEEEIELVEMYARIPIKVWLFDGVYFTESTYMEFNEGIDFEKNVLILKGSRFSKDEDKDEYDANVKTYINKCMNIIMNELEILNLYYYDKSNKYTNLYFEGRIQKINRAGEVEITKSQSRRKIGMIYELINLWIESMTHERLRTDIDYLTCVKTRRILLQLLPVFKRGGKLKTFSEYKKDVETVNNAIETYANKIMEREMDYESQIRYLVSTKSFKNLTKRFEKYNPLVKNIFYANIIDKRWNSVREIEMILEEYIECYEKLEKEWEERTRRNENVEAIGKDDKNSKGISQFMLNRLERKLINIINSY